MSELELHQPKKTGEFMFQFDNDEPILISGIMDNQEVKICLKQQEKGFFSLNQPSIEFKSECGKSFKLFIKDI